MAYLQASLLASFNKAGLMTIETSQNVVEARFSMARRGFMNGAPENPFHVYIRNLTGVQVNISKFMNVAPV